MNATPTNEDAREPASSTGAYSTSVGTDALRDGSDRGSLNNHVHRKQPRKLAFVARGPKNLEAERSVLSAMLVIKNAVRNVVPILRPDHFYLPRHAVAFGAIVESYNTSGNHDPIAVAEVLRRQRRREVDVHLLLDLAEDPFAMAAAADVEHHARIVRQQSELRHVVELCLDIAFRIYNAEDDRSLLLDLIDGGDAVQPNDIEQRARNSSHVELLRTLDPKRDLLDSIASTSVLDWLRCPECEQRAVCVVDAVDAWCASCGGRWTRYAIVQRVLASSLACRRIAGQIRAEREVS